MQNTLHKCGKQLIIESRLSSAETTVSSCDCGQRYVCLTMCLRHLMTIMLRHLPFVILCLSLCYLMSCFKRAANKMDKVSLHNNIAYRVNKMWTQHKLHQIIVAYPIVRRASWRVIGESNYFLLLIHLQICEKVENYEIKLPYRLASNKLRRGLFENPENGCKVNSMQFTCYCITFRKFHLNFIFIAVQLLPKLKLKYEAVWAI